MLDPSQDKIVRLGLIAGISMLGFFAVRGPLESPRPTLEPPDHRPALPHEDVEARLWQDPFYPVAQHQHAMEGAREQPYRHPDEDADAHAEHHHGAKPLCEEVETRLYDHGRDVVVVPVMVSGAPYAEDVERRKRSRYAVIAALQKEGYHPVSQEHIGYVDMLWPPGHGRDRDQHDGADEGSEQPGHRTGDSSAPAHGVDQAPSCEHAEESGRHPGNPQSGAEAGDNEGETANDDDGHQDRVLIPFEWFVSAGNDDEGDRAVLVLWVADELTTRWTIPPETSDGEDAGSDQEPLTHVPLKRLSQLVYKLLPEGTEAKRSSEQGPSETSGRVSVRIIGPAGSATLRHMASESLWYENQESEPENGPSRPSLSGWKTEIYSSWSTMDERKLGLLQDEDEERGNPPADGEAPDEHEAEVKRPARYHLHVSPHADTVPLLRTIHSDRVVLREVIAELGRRGVDVTQDHHHVVLVAESDTEFGRSLPETFEELIREERDDHPEDLPNVHRRTYLRGIDGRLPGSEPGVGRRSPEGGGLLPEELGRVGEPAAGRAQLDYVERLASSLGALDRDLKRKGEPKRKGERWGEDGRVRAIGVLGSDVYDKLLLISALRPEFPDAVFFTTDMDAIYDDPGEMASLRNLVIGSTFGLELGEDWQWRSPPFRNTYQVAKYLATQLAVQDGKALGRTPAFSQPTRAWLGDPRIFEIGTRGHVDLTPAKDRGDYVQSVNPTGSSPEVTPDVMHPPRSTVTRRWRTSLVAIFGLLLAGFTLWRRGSGWSRLRRSDPLQLQRRRPFAEPLIVTTAAVVGGLAVAWLALVWFGDPHGEGKPTLGIHGVSTWVSDGLHLAALFAAAALSFKCLMILSSLADPLLRRAARVRPRGEEDWWDRRLRRLKARLRLWGWRASREQGEERHLANPALKWLGGAVLVLLTFLIVLAINRYIYGGRGVYVPQRSAGLTSIATGTFLAWSAALVATTFLTVSVCDMMRRCTQFSESLLRRSGRRPVPALGEPRADRAAEAAADVRHVAEVTQPVVGVVAYPLFPLALLGMARLPFFDGWGWPYMLIGLLVVLAAAPVAASLYLHIVARAEREDLIKRLQADAAVDETETAPLRQVDEGAFLQLWRDPVAEAMLVAVALAAGILLLIQRVPTF